MLSINVAVCEIFNSRCLYLFAFASGENVVLKGDALVTVFHGLRRGIVVACADVNDTEAVAERRTSFESV